MATTINWFHVSHLGITYNFGRSIACLTLPTTHINVPTIFVSNCVHLAFFLNNKFVEEHSSM